MNPDKRAGLYIVRLNPSWKFQTPDFFKKPGVWAKRGCANHLELL